MHPKGEKMGIIIVGILTVGSALLWLIAAPFATRVSSSAQIFLSLGQLTSLTGTALFSLTLILSARLKIFEKVFLGLNRVYERHSQFGQLAIILMLFHPILLLPQYTGSLNEAAAFLLPGSNWAQNWGILALALMIILITLTLYLRPRYDIWKWTHKFLGLAFFLGALHVWMISSDTSRFLPLRVYVLALAGLGLAAFLYRAVFGKYLIQRLSYKITNIKNLNDAIVEISLKPEKSEVTYKPGQFIFIQFPGSKLGAESHPFSLVSIPSEPEIRIAIKNLGDYTSMLETLRIGDRALIEGPYGAFSAVDKKYKEQIWVAGGIGITPFIPMAVSLNPKDGFNIDLFYCLKNPKEAVYLEILEKIAQNPDMNFRLHFFCSVEKGRISADTIEKATGLLINKDVLICAPPPMIQSLKNQLFQKKVPSELIHSEEFNL